MVLLRTIFLQIFEEEKVIFNLRCPRDSRPHLLISFACYTFTEIQATTYVSVAESISVVGTLYSGHYEDIQAAIVGLHYRMLLQHQLLQRPPQNQQQQLMQVRHARRYRDSVQYCALVGRCVSACLHAELQCVALAWRRMNVEAQQLQQQQVTETETEVSSVRGGSGGVRVQLGPYVYVDQALRAVRTDFIARDGGNSKGDGDCWEVDDLATHTLRCQQRTDLAMAMLVLVQSCL